MIGIYSPIWAVLLVVGAVIWAGSPLGRAADPPPQPGREENAIDGLRGFLALAVFLHHGAIWEDRLRSGNWRLPPVRDYTLFGQFGVAFFFLITAYLFWGKVLKGRVRWADLYISRLFRIGPLYLCAFAVVLAIVLIAGPGEPLRSFLAQLGEWSLLGLGGSPDLNGYRETNLLLAGVTWSLQYEWAFYLALPLLALFRRYALAFALFGLAACVAGLHVLGPMAIAPLSCAALFFSGMVCATLRPLPQRLLPAGSAVCLALFVVIFALCPTAYAPKPVLLAAAAFYPISSNASLFGVLRTRPALRLGNISYGVYLLQGLAYDAVFAVGPVRRFALSGSAAYWAVAALALALLLGASTLAHVLVERPGITAGRWISARLRERRGRADAPSRVPVHSQP